MRANHPFCASFHTPAERRSIGVLDVCGVLPVAHHPVGLAHANDVLAPVLIHFQFLGG